MPDEQRPDPFGDVEPSAFLKQRIIGTLRSAGVLEAAERSPWRFARTAATLAAALVVGFALGRAERASGSELPRYLLLLYEESTYRDDRPVAQIIAEYARWADSLREAGALEAGEKLADQRVELTSVGRPPSFLTGEPSPTGFFIIRAANAGIAREIGASSPHLRQGGRIMLHRIEDTSTR